MNTPGQRHAIGSRGQRGTEEGFALLLAVVVAVFLSLIGLALTTSSLGEFVASSEFGAHERALVVADSGMNLSRNLLRGRNLTATLGSGPAMPKYVPYDEPAPGSYAARNPMPPTEARVIDFNNPPAPIASRSVLGLLTPPEGISVGRGRFFARLSDNPDEALGSGTDDPLVDVDQTVYVRVMAVHPGAPSARPSGTPVARNALAILEATLRRDMSFDMASPLLVYGPDIDSTFNGNSFDITGDDEHPALGVLYNNPSGGDASTSYQSLLRAVGNKGRLRGAPGPDGRSIADMTESVRNSPNQDAQNLFDAEFIYSFARFLANYADFLYSEETTLSGHGVTLGTTDSPKITVALDNLTLSGSGSGAGVLVVLGDLNYRGAFDYDGIILVVGNGKLEMSGANKTVSGGVYLSRIEGLDDGGSGELTFGVPTLDVAGNSNVVFASESLHLAIDMFPMETISLREITPEVEPVEPTETGSEPGWTWRWGT